MNSVTFRGFSPFRLVTEDQTMITDKGKLKTGRGHLAIVPFHAHADVDCLFVRAEKLTEMLCVHPGPRSMRCE